MKFIKMHSLGNDFVITTEVPQDIKQICDRHFGVGCDQLMVVKNTQNGIDLQIFNQDGSIANMCGNGVRCVAGKYFDENPQAQNVEINILPKEQKFMIYKQENRLVKIDMGRPKFGDDNLVNVGNLHKIIDTKCSGNTILDDIANKAEKTPHADYNTNYISVKGDKLFLITIERGAGETLACGSGSVASACFAINNGLTKAEKIQIINKGSVVNNEQLFVEYSNNGNAYLIGGYNYVFNGYFDILGNKM